MIRRRFLTAVLAAAAGCALTSCTASAPSGSDRGGVQHVTIHATDRLRFRPHTVTVHPGRVAVTLVDDGSYPHNLAVPALGVTSGTVTGDFGARSTTTVLDLAHVGRYRFVCTYHASAGMRGTLVVQHP